MEWVTDSTHFWRNLRGAGHSSVRPTTSRNGAHQAVVKILKLIYWFGRSHDLATAASYFHNNTGSQNCKPQNKKGLTETTIFPSAVCFTLNSTSFCAVT